MGNCFEVHAAILCRLDFSKQKLFKDLKININDLILVHANISPVKEMNNTGCSTFGHAWLEYKDTVFDFSNYRQIQMSKKAYYAISQIGDEEAIKYSNIETREMLKKDGNYGQWDLELTEEERLRAKEIQ
ncbi:hypothetical protein A3715_28350 [Oleiphilus sp. HI0009]|nr:hypothetical protein A3715_10505 [Oleiphilus sp. HI0009]KZX85347.1 hypothetical protein A3715_28350 [Oleiphilus sp. HI0009]